MLSLIKAISCHLKKVTARHFFLCCALVVSGVVVIAVPQVRYAFWVEELFSDWLGAVLRVALLAVFLLYNVLSLILLRPPARWRNRLDWPLRTVEASLHWPVALAKRRAEGRRRMLVPCLTALGCLGLAAYFVTPGVLHWYALSDLLAVNVGWLSLLLAAWLILAPSHLKKDDPATHMTVVEVQGRFLGWLVVSYAIEEALWAASSVGLLGSLDWAVGYVLFSGWAFLQAIFLVLMAAHLVDYWDNSSPWPIRMFAAAAFAVLLLLNLTSVPVRELATGEPASANGSGGDAEDRWLEILERRIDAVPVGPAVLVAASGGGSRAAVFSGLAYEAIARLPSFDDHRLAEHVVMISSVSGGSLATAHFISRNARQSAAVERICHTSRRDLIQRSLRFLDNEKAALAERQTSPKVRPEDRKVIAARIAAIENAQGWLREGPPKGPPAPKWLLEHQLFDEMTMDFMAPILRGALTPAVSRGDALQRFWEHRFQWHDTNLDDWWGLEGGDAPPLALLNSCRTTTGTRVVVGLPPLPPKFFSGDRKVRSTRDTYPVLCLSDLKRQPRLRVSQAVRLSSNFPWGFRVRAIESYRLLDGGIVDNTGLDTFCEVFLRLSESDQGQRILGKLARKGVFLIEIDSGAKPGAGGAPRLHSGLVEPLDAVNNASYTNAQITKESYIEGIRSLLADTLKNSLLADIQVIEQPARRELERRVGQIDAENMVIHFPFQCGHFPGSAVGARESVMTAWALGSADKATVLGAFLIEYATVMAEFETLRATYLASVQAVWDIEETIAGRRTEEALASLVELPADVPEDESGKVRYAAAINAELSKVSQAYDHLSSPRERKARLADPLKRLAETSPVFRPAPSGLREGPLQWSIAADRLDEQSVARLKEAANKQVMQMPRDRQKDRDKLGDAIGRYRTSEQGARSLQDRINRKRFLVEQIAR